MSLSLTSFLRDAENSGVVGIPLKLSLKIFTALCFILNEEML